MFYTQNRWYMALRKHISNRDLAPFWTRGAMRHFRIYQEGIVLEGLSVIKGIVLEGLRVTKGIVLEAISATTGIVLEAKGVTKA